MLEDLLSVNFALLDDGVHGFCAGPGVPGPRRQASSEIGHSPTADRYLAEK